MKSNKLMAIFVLSVLVVSFAFSSGEQDTTGDGITLRYYQWWNIPGIGAENMVPEIEAFESLYPNVKIEAAAITNDAYWDRLTLDIASNVEGDIVHLDSTGMLGYHRQRQGGAFLALDDYIKGYTLPDGTSLENDIMGLELMKRDGKIIALPYNQLLFANMAIRKSHLEEVGAKPEDLATWKGFMDTAVKLTRDVDSDGTIDRFGYGHPKDATPLARWWHLHWLWTAGGGVFPKEQPPYTADRLIWAK